MIGNNENKKNTSSFAVYIKLQHISYDKMQLLAICFDNIPSKYYAFIIHTNIHYDTTKSVSKWCT